MAQELDTKSYGIYTYTWKGKDLPFYVGKDSHINQGVRDNQHRTVSPAKTIIDKALQSKARGGLVYNVVAKFPNEKEMTLAEALLIDYYHRRGACEANIVNELFSAYNRKKFWPGYKQPVVTSTPTREAAWIRKGK